MGLLDRSVALDTVDYSILTGRLRYWVGVSGSALNCLSDLRSFSVLLDPYMSETDALSCHLAHDSVLGPILTALHMPYVILQSNLNVSHITAPLMISSCLFKEPVTFSDGIQTLHDIKKWVLGAEVFFRLKEGGCYPHGNDPLYDTFLVPSSCNCYERYNKRCCI